MSARLEMALAEKKKLTLGQFTKKVSAQAPKFARALADEDSYFQFYTKARIDAMNAKMRQDFLDEFEILDAAGVHERAGHTGSNKAQTAADWSRSGRILGLPLTDRTVYPAFQLDADGQPQPLLRPVLRNLRADLSAWQRAFWLVAPNEWLDGRTPIEAIAARDEAVVDAAIRTGETVIG